MMTSQLVFPVAGLTEKNRIEKDIRKEEENLHSALKSFTSNYFRAKNRSYRLNGHGKKYFF